MTLVQILFFALISIPFMGLVPAQWRPWDLFAGSLIFVAWLMSDGVPNRLDLILYAATIFLVVAVWWIIRDPQSTDDEPVSADGKTDAKQTATIIGAIVLGVALVALLRNSELSPVSIFGGFGILSIAAVSVARLGKPQDNVKLSKSLHQFALLLIVVIVFILVILKTPIFAKFSGLVLSQDDSSIATATPLIWLGFSYFAFRLMALLLDYRAGRLPKEKLSLRDVITYALFFPAFTAGPIDRVQRFAPELEQAKALVSARLVEGGTRIAVGVFKKFVIADSLALVAMKPDLIERTNGVFSLWILVYLYSLQIFFDFSGYSDVAIGLGRLYGITLPENFDRPYIQRNIQQFWQRWHITLSTWFRVYWFTPFSRTLIRSVYKIPQWVIVLLSQLTTMFLIGMWHGVTLNFAVWGIWHGVGLFLHKTLADNSKLWFKRVNERAWSRRLMYVGSVFVTFHFVTLGWVFFALPHISDSLDLFLRLFGVRA